jgi:hypothetical protein
MYSRLNSEEWLSNRLTPSAPVASPRNESPGSCPSAKEATENIEGDAMVVGRWSSIAEAPFPSSMPRAIDATAEIGHLLQAQLAARESQRAKLTRSYDPPEKDR